MSAAKLISEMELPKGCRMAMVYHEMNGPYVWTFGSLVQQENDVIKVAVDFGDTLEFKWDQRFNTFIHPCWNGWIKRAFVYSDSVTYSEDYTGN